MDTVMPMIMDYLAIVLHAIIASVLASFGLNKLMPKKVAFNKKTIIGLTFVIFSVLFLKTRYF